MATWISQADVLMTSRTENSTSPWNQEHQHLCDSEVSRVFHSNSRISREFDDSVESVASHQAFRSTPVDNAESFANQGLNNGSLLKVGS